MNENPMMQTQRKSPSVVEGVAKGLVSIPLGFLDDFVSLAEDLTGWVTGTEQEWFDVAIWNDEELGTGGMITREIGSFALGMITGSAVLSGLGKVGKLGKLGKLAGYLGKGARGVGGLGQKIAGGAAVGAGADFIHGETEGGNLSNLISQFPILANPVADFLSHKEDDSKMERRLKNTLEGIPLGVATDFLFEGFRKVLKVKRAAIDEVAKGNPEKTAEMIERETLVAIPKIQDPGSQKMIDEIGAINRVLDGKNNAAPETIARQAETVFDSARASDPEYLVQYAQGLRQSKPKEAPWKHVVSELSPDELAASIETAEKNGRLGNYYRSLSSIQSEAADEKTARKVIKDLTGLEMDVKMTEDLATKILVWKDFLAERFEYTQGFAKRIVNNGIGSLNDLEKMQFSEGIAQIADVLPLFRELRSNTARATTAQRIDVGGLGGRKMLRKIKPEDLQDAFILRKMREMADKADSNGALEDVAKLLHKHGDELANGSYGKVAKALEKNQRGSKFLQLLTEYRTTNILSGAATQGINILGNMLNYVLRDVVDQLGTSLVGAIRRDPNRQSLTSTIAGVKGFWHGMKDFQVEAGMALAKIRDEQGMLRAMGGISDALDAANLVKSTRIQREGLANGAISARYLGIENKPLGTLIDGWGKLQRGIAYGPMSATDNAIQHASFIGSVERQLTQLALDEHIAADRMGEFIQTGLEAVKKLTRKGEIPENIQGVWRERLEKIYTTAMGDAQRNTFAHALDPNGTVGQLGRWLNRKDSLTPQIVKALFVPFFKTPVNILDSVWAHTPVLAMLRREYKAVMSGVDQIAKDRMVAQMLTGSLLYTGAASLYFTGALTGGHDDDERADLLAAGIPEYSVKIGDSFYSYDRLDPFGSILGMTADICSASRYLSESEYSKVFGTLVMALTNNITNKSYMEGMAQIFQFADDPVNYSQRIGANQLSALIPLVGTQRTINQALTPELKETRSLIDRVMANTVFKGRLDDKLDVFGEGIAHESTPLALIFGIRKKTPTDSPGYRELARYRMFPKDREVSIQGTMTDSNEYYRYKEILKELGAGDALDRVVGTQTYQRSPDAARKRMLERTVRSYRTTARRLLLRETPELRGRILQERKRTLALLYSERTNGVAGNWRQVRDYRVEDEIE